MHILHESVDNGTLTRFNNIESKITKERIEKATQQATRKIILAKTVSTPLD